MELTLREMRHLEKSCLSCRFFRPQDTQSGLCRFDKSKSPDDYPVMWHSGSCEEWTTAGQQYYIRAGWVRKQMQLQAVGGVR